jgi:hypothetical protein
MIIAIGHHQLKLVADGEPAEGRLTSAVDERSISVGHVLWAIVGAV